MSVLRKDLVTKLWSPAVFGLSAVLLLGLSGCETLRVKLALRDFARAAKRRDKDAISAHSTKRLRRLVWSRIPGPLWKMKWPGGGSKGAGGNSQGGGSVKVSVRVQGRRAGARVRWKGLWLNFSLRKQRGWKIDDLLVRWHKGNVVSQLNLTRDMPVVLAVYDFVMAAYHGRRDEMVRRAGPTLLAGGWQNLPRSLFARVAARLQAPSKGPSTGPSDRVSSVFFRKEGGGGVRRMGLTMTSGLHLEVIAVAGKKGWMVDDVLLTQPRGTGSVRRMRLSHLLATARVLYDFGRKLAGSDLIDVKSVEAHVARAGGPKTRSRRPGPGGGARDWLAKMVASLSLDDFDDRAGSLWVAFSWKDARGRLDFSLQGGRWKLLDARLDRDGRSIRLADALGMRDLMVSLIQASLQADVERIEKLSSSDLNLHVWSRLGPIDRLKRRLLGGGLDEILGIAVLPKNVFAKLGFGARIALLARRLASGRLRLVGLWREGNRAFLVIRVGSVPVTVQAVDVGGKWLLDDVTWRVAGKRLSLKRRAGALLQTWFGPAARGSS